MISLSHFCGKAWLARGFCRSPSIGARIKGIDMRGQPHPKGMSGPARITAILSAFPANAELKELCFNRVKDMDALLKLLLGGEAEASVRMRCSTVDKLSFQVCPAPTPASSVFLVTCMQMASSAHRNLMATCAKKATALCFRAGSTFCLP